MPPRSPASPSFPSSSSPLSSSPDSVVAALRAAGCVFAEDEARLILAAARTPDELAAMVDGRVGGRPLELVLGWAEFRGLRITVEPGVFVPRRRTEFLVEQALAQVPDASVVVDLCCGSGAVGAALAATLGHVELHAADIEPAAVHCARGNVAEFGGHVHAGDLFDALPRELRGRVDILAANVPYVPTGEVDFLPAEAREHEPLVALDGGADGLVARPRRLPARRDERTAGADGRRGLPELRPATPPGRLGGAVRQRGGRNPAVAASHADRRRCRADWGR